MDIVIIAVVTALVVGATTVAQGLASAAGEDLYIRLKRLISDRYIKVMPFVEAVEIDPASEPARQVLAKELYQAGAARDKELADVSQALLGLTEELRGNPKAEALITFAQAYVAGNMQLEDIDAGKIIDGLTLTVDGNLTLKRIRQKKN